MRIVYLLVVLATLLISPATILAYSDPTIPPPDGNTQPPLNVGPANQVKEGDLGVRNLRARNGINLGGVFRDNWLPEGSRCAWQGVKCHCVSDGSSIGNIRLAIGVACDKGQVTGQRIITLDISSRIHECSSTALAGCSPELYTFRNQGNDESGNVIVRTVQGVVTATTNFFVRTFRAIRDFFGGLF